jgi:hypothetical protein
MAHDLVSGTDTVIGYSALFSGPKPQISGNGRFVVFLSASDVPGDAGDASNVYLYDVQTKTTTLVSFNRERSGPCNGPSDSPSTSADGRFVVYRSFASDLVTGDNNGQPDVFEFDRLSGTNTLISVNQSGTASANNSSSAPSISADGGTVVFRSLASDLVTGDLNNTEDVFVAPLSVAAWVDSDGDGMDDAWEKAYFGDLSHNGLTDSDGDGGSDLFEFKAGTNPMDAASRFTAQASVAPGNGLVSIQWEALSGRSYRVQFKNDMNESDWTDLPGGVTVNGSKASCLDNTTSASSQRFYRVTLVE